MNMTIILKSEFNHVLGTLWGSWSSEFNGKDLYFGWVN